MFQIKVVKSEATAFHSFGMWSPGVKKYLQWLVLIRNYVKIFIWKEFILATFYSADFEKAVIKILSIEKARLDFVRR